MGAIVPTAQSSAAMRQFGEQRELRFHNWNGKGHLYGRDSTAGTIVSSVSVIRRLRSELGVATPKVAALACATATKDEKDSEMLAIQHCPSDIFPRTSPAGTTGRWHQSGILGRASSIRSRQDAGCRRHKTAQ